MIKYGANKYQHEASVVSLNILQFYSHNANK